mgnify:CR=1 FL=1
MLVVFSNGKWMYNTKRKEEKCKSNRYKYVFYIKYLIKKVNIHILFGTCHPGRYPIKSFR